MSHYTASGVTRAALIGGSVLPPTVAAPTPRAARPDQRAHHPACHWLCRPSCLALPAGTQQQQSDRTRAMCRPPGSAQGPCCPSLQPRLTSRAARSDKRVHHTPCLALTAGTSQRPVRRRPALRHAVAFCGRVWFSELDDTPRVRHAQASCAGPCCRSLRPRPTSRAA